MFTDARLLPPSAPSGKVLDRTPFVSTPNGLNPDSSLKPVFFIGALPEPAGTSAESFAKSAGPEYQHPHRAAVPETRLRRARIQAS